MDNQENAQEDNQNKPSKKPNDRRTITEKNESIRKSEFVPDGLTPNRTVSVV